MADDVGAAVASSNVSGIATTLEDAIENFTNESAFMVCYERGLEMDRDDPLFIDPLAKRLAAMTKGERLSEDFGKGAHVHFQFHGWPEFHQQWTAVRTKFIDDTLRRLLQQGETGGGGENEASTKYQFVNLGAGLDMRVYRLSCLSSAAAAYEVDMEEINKPKQLLFYSLLQKYGGTSGKGGGDDTTTNYKPVCPRKLVSANLKQQNELTSALKGAGFDPTNRSIFVAEGLIMYLEKAQAPFLKEVSSIASPGSSLILNFLDGPVPTSERGLTTEEIKNLLQAEGWMDLKFHQYGDDVLNYGRFQPQFKPSPYFSFVTCTKR